MPARSWRPARVFRAKNFSLFLGRCPDQASAEELRRYRLHLAQSGVSVPSQNATVTARCFFFTVTLARAEATARMPFVREPRKLPVVLNREEGARLVAGRTAAGRVVRHRLKREAPKWSRHVSTPAMN